MQVQRLPVTALSYEHMAALADNQGSCPLWCLPQASYSHEVGFTEAIGPTNFPHSIPTWNRGQSLSPASPGSALSVAGIDGRERRGGREGGREERRDNRRVVVKSFVWTIEP